MRKTLSKKNRGFTLIELMIVVAIIGILAAVAIPNFLKYQLRAKSSEASVNLSAIQTSEIAYYGSHDNYLEAPATPSGTANTQRRDWPSPQPSDPEFAWENLGWKPEGSVYFTYQVEITEASTNGGNFTATAIGDLDGNNEFQCWLFQKRDSAGNVLAPSNTAACSQIQSSRQEQVYKAAPDGIF